MSRELDEARSKLSPNDREKRDAWTTHVGMTCLAKAVVQGVNTKHAAKLARLQSEVHYDVQKGGEATNSIRRLDKLIVVM